jgi:hypothetical protein
MSKEEKVPGASGHGALGASGVNDSVTKKANNGKEHVPLKRQ